MPAAIIAGWLLVQYGPSIPPWGWIALASVAAYFQHIVF